MKKLILLALIILVYSNPTMAFYGDQAVSTHMEMTAVGHDPLNALITGVVIFALFMCAVVFVVGREPVF